MTAGLRVYFLAGARHGMIEIIGRPGSGKSYLCKFLAASPGWRVAPGSGESGRWWLAPLTFVLRPAVSMLATAAAYARPPADIHRFRQVIRAVRKYDGTRRIKSSGITVVDEGPVHALFNIFFGSTSTTASRLLTRQLIRLLSRRPTLFLHLDIGDEAAVENTKRRHDPGSWFNREMSGSTAERLAADESYSEIVDTLTAIVPEKVLRFSSVPEALEFLTQLPQSSALASEPAAVSWTGPGSRRSIGRAT